MKSPLKRRAILVNGALGILLVGGIAAAYFSLADDDADASQATRTTRVQRGTVVSSVSASGNVESSRTRSLSFGTSGTVTNVYVKAGQKVAKGKVLAKLDQTEALESLTAAKASLAVAEDGDTDTAQGYSSYVQAKNSYNQAVRTYEATVLRAPFAGTITAVNGEVGGSSSGSSSSSDGSSTSTGGGTSTGSTGSTSSGSSSSGGFIDLADTGNLQIKGDFTEADTTKLKVGQSATVSFDALTGKTATGKISAIDTEPTTSDNVVQYGATITLTDVPSGVRLGQTATVEVTVARAANALYVPTAAVTTAGGQSTVTVMQSGQRVVKTVQVGVKGDTGTQITSGLNEGDEVVITTTTSGTGSTGGFPGGGIPGGGGGGLGGGPGGAGGAGGGGRR